MHFPQKHLGPDFFRGKEWEGKIKEGQVTKTVTCIYVFRYKYFRHDEKNLLLCKVTRINRMAPRRLEILSVIPENLFYKHTAKSPQYHFYILKFWSSKPTWRLLNTTISIYNQEIPLYFQKVVLFLSKPRANILPDT